MSYTLHIPDNFKYLKSIEKFINENDLTIKYLQTNSKSCHVLGDQDNIEKLLSFINIYLEDGVIAFNSDKPLNAKTYLKKTDIQPHLHLNANASTYPFFSAKDVGNIYNISNSQKTRTNIAIIELGGGYKSADLTKYWTYLGLTKKPNVYSISVDGVYNSPGNDADMEVVLDIEVVGGICPYSNIYVYFAPNTNQGFYDAIHNAVYSTTHPVSVVSISWGGPENSWDINSLNAFNGLFQQAAQKGITVCAASGDSGSSDGETTGNHVDFPASSPWVLACGGTNLVCPNRIYSSATTKETVWGTIPNNGAAGGGFSSVFAKPSYQTTTSKNYSSIMRGVPDVCGNADPSTGWTIYINGAYNHIGGTSAVAPMWAAYLAGLGYKKFLNPILYDLYLSNKKIVNDILVGNEGAYSAKNGWDAASGLGSPNGLILTPLLNSN